MEKYLFKSGKNIYKANLHCHTTVSDGAWTPEKTKDMYKARGYAVVAFTDHNIIQNHSYLNDSEFLALNACEVDLAQNSLRKSHDEPLASTEKVYHFNLYSENPDISHTPPLMHMDYNEINAINQYIKDRTDEGYLVCYNHPFWSLQTYEDYSKLKGCFAMEIYNHSTEATDGYYGYNPQVYDEMLRCQNKIYCLSTDDNHSLENSFGGFVMINSRRLTYEDIIKSLKDGDFYSSQGPHIYEISLQNNKLHVKCSDACLIVVYTDGRDCYIKKGEHLNEAEFLLNGKEKYIRVMCRDKEHKDANSNAYWL